MTEFASPTPPARNRPPISMAPIGLVTLLTAGTGATLGVLAWREKLAGSRALMDAAMHQAARMTTDHAAQFLDHAEGSYVSVRVSWPADSWLQRIRARWGIMRSPCSAPIVN